MAISETSLAFQLAPNCGFPGISADADRLTTARSDGETIDEKARKTVENCGLGGLNGEVGIRTRAFR
jgi:hypothetical protein